MNNDACQICWNNNHTFPINKLKTLFISCWKQLVKKYREQSESVPELNRNYFRIKQGTQNKIQGSMKNKKMTKCHVAGEQHPLNTMRIMKTWKAAIFLCSSKIENKKTMENLPSMLGSWGSYSGMEVVDGLTLALSMSMTPLKPIQPIWKVLSCPVTIVTCWSSSPTHE